MSTVRLIEESEAEGKTAEVYEDIQRTFGVLPDLFKALGNRPEVLEATWMRVKTIMTSGTLDRKTKEFIAVAISATNACSYCIDTHTAMLKGLGASDQEIVEALSVADLFNGLNAFATGVRLDSDLKP